MYFPYRKASSWLLTGEISRIISAINLMDAPDIINWMKEGELLLTTAYGIKDSP